MLGLSAYHITDLPLLLLLHPMSSVYDLLMPSAGPVDVLNHTSRGIINAIAFNTVETSILASCDLDRAISLYDLRTLIWISQAILTMSANTIFWNPMEAFNFAVGSEDLSIYVFDMRNLSRSLNILKDHISAVTDVDFSPTGEELVSASYDRTIRLWKRSEGHSRDVYHTKRMQRVFCATFSSGSKHRHIPKQIKRASEIRGEEVKALNQREENRIKHSHAPAKRSSAREKMVLETVQ
ncbi:hypothetical protein B7463_g4850, partial [Scytalidium lignicola]